MMCLFKDFSECVFFVNREDANFNEDCIFFVVLDLSQELYMLLTWRDGRTAGPLRLDDAMAADGGKEGTWGGSKLYTPEI